MPIVIKKKLATKTVVAAKSASKPGALKSALTKATNGVKKVVKAAKAIQYATTDALLGLINTHKIDAATAWAGDHIDRTIPQALVGLVDALKSAKLDRPKDRVLVLQGRSLFAWKLTGLKGDIYERLHNDGMPKAKAGQVFPVRGSVKLLQSKFGASKVRIVSRAEALKMVGQMKSDAWCVAALKGTA